MSKTKILEWFDSNSSVLTSRTILMYLFIALAIGIIIYLTYRFTYTGVSYNNKFAITNLIVLLIATVLMMMISSNIAISLGMVGALSIVRYRTAIKDPNDTLFIFWSIVEGLCVGAQMIKIATISTLFIGIIIICASYFGFINKKYLIIIRGNAKLQTSQVTSAINTLYKKNKVRTASHTESSVEMIIEVTGKTPLTEEQITSLKQIDGMSSINWLLQSGECVG